MSSKKLAILLGHSHTGALVQAITTRKPGAPTGCDELHVAMYEAWKFQGHPPYMAKGADGADRFNPAVIDAAAHYIKFLGRPLYIAIFGGNDWAVMSMMRHNRSFDFILPEAEDLPLDEGAEIVPLGYIESILRSLTDVYMVQLHNLRQAVAEPICSFLAPPPMAENAIIEEKMDDFFRKNTNFSLTVSSKYLRLKMWMLQRRIQERVCRENDIALMDIPAAAMTPEGFLDRSCHGKDATHANVVYGELMLKQLEAATGAELRSWYWFS